MRSGDLASRRLNRQVWVKLPVVFRQTQYPPGRFRWDDRTLDVSGELWGILHDWYRAATGEWYGLVSYGISYAHAEITGQLQLDDQLVPADALRPRLYGREHRA